MAANPFGSFGGLGLMASGGSNAPAKLKKKQIKAFKKSALKDARGAAAQAGVKLDKKGRIKSGGGGIRHRPAGSPSGGRFF